MNFALPSDVDRELVDRARETVPLLATHAARTESERQVVPEVMAALETYGRSLFGLDPIVMIL